MTLQVNGDFVLSVLPYSTGSSRRLNVDSRARSGNRDLDALDNLL
jgi:hypothetical protein